MKVIIDVPKEFEDDIRDNFQDFFERVKVEIAHRVNTDDTLLCENYERETAEMFLEAFENMQVIPKVVTNGDMIMTMFPNAEVNVTKYSYVVEVKLPYHTKHDTGLLFDKDFWNAPYEVIE